LKPQLFVEYSVFIEDLWVFYFKIESYPRGRAEQLRFEPWEPSPVHRNSVGQGDYHNPDISQGVLKTRFNVYQNILFIHIQWLHLWFHQNGLYHSANIQDSRFFILTNQVKITMVITLHLD